MERRTDEPDASTYYTVAHPEEFQLDWKSFYRRADELTADARKRLIHHLHIPYGSHPKQKLDIYLPKKTFPRAPVYLFLHGGGFREGDRGHYGYVALPLANHGIMTVVAGYRLAPDFPFPNQPRDVQHALAWVYQNIHAYGGDPGRIFIGGHSAGGNLAVFVSLRSSWFTEISLPGDLIKGCAGLSARYDFRPDPPKEYLPEPAQAGEASPLLHIETFPPRMLIAVGSSLRPEERLVASSREFAQVLEEKGCPVEMLFLEGMTHVDTALALAEEESALFQAVLRMIHHQMIDNILEQIRPLYFYTTTCKLGPGKKPAVLVVDFMRGSRGGLQGGSLVEGVWNREISATAELIRLAHARNVPVIYTTVEYSEEEPSSVLLSEKTPWIAGLRRNSPWTDVNPGLPVEDRDMIIRKKYGSAFFGTDLISKLVAHEVDTILLCGAVTSGCIRASAVDAVQLGFRPLVVREAVGDRSRIAHETNLMDIEMRYGDVISLKQALEILSKRYPGRGN